VLKDCLAREEWGRATRARVRSGRGRAEKKTDRKPKSNLRTRGKRDSAKGPNEEQDQGVERVGGCLALELQYIESVN